MNKKYKNKRNVSSTDKKRQSQPHQQRKANLKSPLIFGLHAVREAWLNPSRNIQHLYVTEKAALSFELHIHEARRLNLVRPEMQIIDKESLDKTLPRESVHQGIALVCDPLPEVDVMDVIIKAKQDSSSVVLMLDQVTDPHNVGALIRSASAFGADGIIMQRRHAPELKGVLAKTACGAVEHIDIAQVTNLSRCIEDLQDEGFVVYGLDERGDIEIGEIEKGGHVVLVLGAEGAGLRRLVAEKCTQLVRLPTSGAIQSLNVSNAGAVALYAVNN